jgi:ABC-2 type transport system ATP-binding protein
MVSSPVVASHLGKSFGDRQVLHDLSFKVEPGDVIGVLGKNGAGKTTLLELVLGFSQASAGDVRVFGQESHRLPADLKARVGFVPQQDELLEQLTVRDQLRVIASFYSNWDDALIARLCSEWSITLDARIKKMSVGERQKLSILLAFGHRPELLILDEPVASLDPLARRQFLEQLVELSASGERSIVFSSHIVSDIERLANKIWILKDGRFDWQGDLDSLKESVVRIHLRSPQPLPSDLKVPGALSMRMESTFATAVVRDWTEVSHAQIERQSGATVEVEALGLEEIFLELNR